MKIKQMLPKWIFIIALYWLVCFYLGGKDGYAVAKGIGFNVFLALLPLLFIRIFEAARPVTLKILFFGLWLLFLPNTFYMITDLIHVPPNMEWVDEAWQVLHNPDSNSWLFLIIIGLGFFIAFMLGIKSMQICFSFAKERFGPFAAHCTAAAVSLLCGVGIYIGRFLRFNSWDIANPVQLAMRLFSSLNLFAVKIILFFGLCIFAMYYFFTWISAPDIIKNDAKEQEP